eukprot:TRINITY_DN52261_c0_g1_i1.p2 TRINITY_DN52261_c0_g1~~TRINITY_DN52261_c0_g1_i1.p2  ORF type:complete len:148 (+),score=11.78 TRINITY_DN52261_c0_g1_i1:213-656(+)
MTTEYRIRPRKCRHVFHIECLLQWWTEGTCPVCSVSFAPSGPPAQGDDAGAGAPDAAAVLPPRPCPGGDWHGPGVGRHPAASQVSSAGPPGRGGARERGSGSIPSRGGGVSPILSRPAGLPGPNTFGGAGVGAGSGVVEGQRSPTTL